VPHSPHAEGGSPRSFERQIDLLQQEIDRLKRMRMQPVVAAWGSSPVSAGTARDPSTARSSGGGSAVRRAVPPPPALPPGLSGGFRALCAQKDGSGVTSRLNFEFNRTRTGVHLINPPPVDTPRQDMVPSCGTCMKDGDKTLAIAWLRELSNPTLRSLNLFCHVHTMMGMADLGTKLKDKTNKHRIMELFQRIVESWQRPSQHKRVADKFVEWIRHDLDEGAFASALAMKFHHMPLTTRTCAALGYDQGGIPTHDNATERGNATAHAATRKKRGGFGQTLRMVSTFVTQDSLLDHSFADNLRQDVWGVKALQTILQLGSFRVHPCTNRCSTHGCNANCEVVINPVECGIEMKLPLEALNDNFRNVPPDTAAKDAVWDLEAHVVKMQRKVVLVPTATTLASILSTMPARRAGQKPIDEDLIRDLLQQPCSDGMPSWVDTFALLMDLTLDEFMEGTHFKLENPKPMSMEDVADWMVAFSIMTNETDPAIVERILSKYERGVPSTATGAYRQGATVDRTLAARIGVWLCRCPGDAIIDARVHCVPYVKCSCMQTSPPPLTDHTNTLQIFSSALRACMLC
jgi:hypothetical protein